MKTDTSDEMGE